MKSNEITAYLDRLYPPQAAEDWDNPGLIVGRDETEVHKIMTALDATEETIAEAKVFGAQLLITHHPLIFSGLKSVSDRNLIGRRVLALLESGINCYAMHTNFDIFGMSALNEEQIHLQNAEVLYQTGEADGTVVGIGRIGDVETPMNLKAFAQYVKEQLQLPSLRMYGNAEKSIHKAAISGGSGKSVVSSALQKGAEVLITGDLDYHTCIDSVAEGMAILDAGHYGTEYVFMEHVKSVLNKQFPQLEIKTASVRHPFQEI